MSNKCLSQKKVYKAKKIRTYLASLVENHGSWFNFPATAVAAAGTVLHTKKEGKKGNLEGIWFTMCVYACREDRLLLLLLFLPSSIAISYNNPNPTSGCSLSSSFSLLFLAINQHGSIPLFLVGCCWFSWFSWIVFSFQSGLDCLLGLPTLLYLYQPYTCFSNNQLRFIFE